MSWKCKNDELARAKEEAENASLKYSELYDYAPSGYFSLSKDGNITKQNYSGAGLLNKERTLLHNSLFAFFISDDTRPDFTLFLDKIFEHKTNENCEVTIITQGNDPKEVYLTGKVDTHGENALIVATDITDRKKSETDLLEKETQYYNLANAGAALVWRAGTDKLCNYFNNIWLEFTGRTLEQEIGNGWAEGVHPDDLQRCLTIYTTSFDKREYFEMEYRLLHVSGEYRWLLDMGKPIYDLGGEFTGYIGHCFDITSRKQTDEMLLEKMNQLEQFQRLTVNRELAMIELKKEINEMLIQSGQKAKYVIVE